MAACMTAQTLVCPVLRAERTNAKGDAFPCLFLQGCPTRKRTAACENMTFSWTPSRPGGGEAVLEAQDFPDFALDGLLSFPTHQALS